MTNSRTHAGKENHYIVHTDYNFNKWKKNIEISSPRKKANISNDFPYLSCDDILPSTLTNTQNTECKHTLKRKNEKYHPMPQHNDFEYSSKEVPNYRSPLRDPKMTSDYYHIDAPIGHIYIPHLTSYITRRRS